MFTLSSTTSGWKPRLMVASLAGGAASHRAAAALHGLDGIRPGVLDVSVPREVQGWFPGCRVHHWSYTDEADIVLVDGIRTTSVARTLVQLGRVVSAATVEQALDSALRYGHRLEDIEAVLRRLWRPGPTGAGVLRAVLESSDRSAAVPDSWFESVLFKLLRNHTTLEPVLQHEVATATGTTRRLDLAFPDVKLGVEAHSRAFHFGASKGNRDMDRHLELAAAGWQIIYVTWAMTRSPDELVASIASSYHARLTRTAS